MAGRRPDAVQAILGALQPGRRDWAVLCWARFLRGPVVAAAGFVSMRALVRAPAAEEQRGMSRAAGAGTGCVGWTRREAGGRLGCRRPRF